MKVKCACGNEIDLPEAIVKNSGVFYKELEKNKLQVSMDGLFHLYFGTCSKCGHFHLAIKTC